MAKPKLRTVARRLTPNLRTGKYFFRPPDLSGLSLWLKADSFSTLVDGAAVSTWTSSDSNAYAFTQGTGAAQPLYKANILNGKPIIRFDGTDDYLAYTGLPVGGTQGTLFAVIRPTDANAAHTVYAAGDPTVTNKWFQWTHQTNGRLDVAWQNAGTADQVGSTYLLSTSDFTIVCISSSGTAYTEYLNSASETLITTSGSNAGNWVEDVTTPTTSWVGALVHSGAASGTQFFKGDVAEIINYSTELSATDRTKVLTYLSKKYGIQLRGFSPLQVANLALWLKADAITGLANNDPVATWTASDGNAYVFSQSTASKKPTYKTNILNGQPAVEFDSTDDILIYPAQISTANAGTLFIVASVQTDGLYYWKTLAAGDEADGAKGFFPGYQYKSGATWYWTIQDYGSGKNDHTRANTAIVVGTPSLHTVRSNGSAWSMWRNGVAEALTLEAGTNTGGWFADTSGVDNFTIGGWKTTVEQNHSNIRVFEVILYDATLTDPEVAQVHSFLTLKYGL